MVPNVNKRGLVAFLGQYANLLTKNDDFVEQLINNRGKETKVTFAMRALIVYGLSQNVRIHYDAPLYYVQAGNGDNDVWPDTRPLYTEEIRKLACCRVHFDDYVRACGEYQQIGADLAWEDAYNQSRGLLFGHIEDVRQYAK